MKKIFLIITMVLLLISCGSPRNQQTQDAKSIQVEETVLESTETVIEQIENDIIEYQIITESPEMSEMSTESGQPEEISSPNRVYTIIQPAPKEIKPSIDSIKVNKYEMGKLVYEIPNEMLKLSTYTVTAKIARNKVDLTVYDGMKVVIDTIIRTSETMQVELIDPTGVNFKIISQSVIQFIDMSEPTTWKFFVTPLKYGESELTLVVSIIKNGNLKQTIYNDNVLVRTTTMLEVKVWLSKYWQWFLTVLLLPLFKVGYNRYKKNQK